MVDKRFSVFKFPDVDKFGVNDDIAEITVAFCDEKWEADLLCDLLNRLNDENEQLKKDCTALIYHNQEYRKENEELKHSIKCLEADKMELQQYIKRMQGDDGND